MSDKPIKAISKDFTTEPFYLIQSNGKDKRYVVSLRDKLRIRTLLAGFINQSKNEISTFGIGLIVLIPAEVVTAVSRRVVGITSPTAG